MTYGLLPPWGAMIGVDILLIAISLAASVVVYNRRDDLRRSGALVGVAAVENGMRDSDGFSESWLAARNCHKN